MGVSWFVPSFKYKSNLQNAENLFSASTCLCFFYLVKQFEMCFHDFHLSVEIGWKADTFVRNIDFRPGNSFGMYMYQRAWQSLKSKHRQQQWWFTLDTIYLTLLRGVMAQWVARLTLVCRLWVGAPSKAHWARNFTLIAKYWLVYNPSKIS